MKNVHINEKLCCPFPGNGVNNSVAKLGLVFNSSLRLVASPG